MIGEHDRNTCIADRTLLELAGCLASWIAAGGLGRVGGRLFFSFVVWSMGFGPISETSKFSSAACGRYIGCKQPQNSSSTVMNSSTSVINGLPGGNRKHQKLSMWLNTEQS